MSWSPKKGTGLEQMCDKKWTSSIHVALQLGSPLFYCCICCCCYLFLSAADVGGDGCSFDDHDDDDDSKGD
jgi:hypothetical protein